MEEAKGDLRPGIKLSKSIKEDIKDVDAVFIAVDWPEFRNQDLSIFKHNMQGNLIVDTMNILNSETVEKIGLRYIGVGRNYFITTYYAVSTLTKWC